MKQFVSLMLVFCFVAVAQARMDPVAREAISDIQRGVDNRNQIRDLRVLDSVTFPSQLVSGADLGIVVTDTNVTTTATAYTPAGAGQVLVGGAGTDTNAVWISKGSTTNDWVQVAP